MLPPIVLDVMPPGTNRNNNEACDLAVNVYARTRLRYSLVADNLRAAVGDGVSIQIKADVLQGNATTTSDLRADDFAGQRHHRVDGQI